MRHITFADKPTYRHAILIKNSAFQKNKIDKHYIQTLEANGISADDVICFTLDYDNPKKVTVKTIRAYLERLMPVLDGLKVENLLCADPSYFKVLAKVTNTEKEHGYIKPVVLKDYEHMNVIIMPNHQAVFHNPDTQKKIDFDIEKFGEHVAGNYKELGADVVQDYHAVSTLYETNALLKTLMLMPELTCDVETFSLKHYKAGLGTIGFSWDKHSGRTIIMPDKQHANRAFSKREQNSCKHRESLRTFFENYKGKLIYHNASFDIKILIYNLFMDSFLDQEGLIRGLNIMTRNFDDTKVITYLATNSTAGNKLSLKDQAHEYAGNYAESEINDISKIRTSDLARYNAVDCMCTWYVHEKHWDTLVADNQEKIYREVMLPSLKVIIQMELTGMCLDMDRVHSGIRRVERNLRWYDGIIQTHPAVKATVAFKKTESLLGINAKLKTKQKTLADMTDTFNPNSSKDLQILLHKIMQLPIIDLTDTKQPATGGKTLKKHMNMHVTRTEDKLLLRALCGVADALIIRNNFLKNFAEAHKAEDGTYWLCGNFNLGGTVSGRLSSSDPNMQNIPSSGTPYAKMIKKMFIAPPGWVFCGADFASLEDRISALTTRDPNKLKVYTDGYDGHCLRAYHYFNEHYQGISETPEAINATAKTHKEWRQLSKTPTFALTYGGTFKAIMEQTGMDESGARSIEENYHILYKASDEWVQRHVEQATKDGYVTVAFGLRVRTPILAQTVLGTRSTPYEAQKEARTAGNALGQSWGLLNNRAAVELQEHVLNSVHALEIKPAAHIHDAQYFYVRDNVDAVKFLNDHLGAAMAWQDDPLIYHPEVKLSGELDLFYPNWAYDTTLPNYASTELILQKADEAMNE